MDDIVKESSPSNGLEQLKAIGSRDISKTTHIEEEYIQYILDKNFQKLISYNVKGFIRIIEREYEVNLQMWYDEFRAFKGDMNIEEDKTIRHVVAKNISTTTSYEKKASAWWLWLLILVLGVGAVFYFKLYQYFELIPTLFEDKNRSTTYSNISIIDNAQEKLQTAGVEVPKFDDNKNLITNDTNTTITDNNASLAHMNALDRSIKIENSSSKDDNKTDENLTQNEQASKTSESLHSAYMIPSREIWIGIISLDDNKKTTISTSKPLELNLSKNQLILTGHGVFELEINGKKETFKDRNPIRLLVKDGKVSKITYDEFLKFNNGKAW